MPTRRPTPSRWMLLLVFLWTTGLQAQQPEEESLKMWPKPRFHFSGTNLATSLSHTSGSDKVTYMQTLYRPTIICLGVDNLLDHFGFTYTFQNSAFGFDDRPRWFWVSLPAPHHQWELNYSIHTKGGANPRPRVTAFLSAGLAFGVTPNNQMTEPTSFRLTNGQDTAGANYATTITYEPQSRVSLSAVVTPGLNVRIAGPVCLRMSMKYSQGFIPTAKINADLHDFATDEHYEVNQVFRSSYVALLFGLTVDMNML